MTTNQESLAINVVILHYQFKQVLGQGHFGITYLAEDTRDHTRVAIKEYFPRALAYRDENGYVQTKESTEEAEQLFEWGLQQFRKEVLTLARFNHANIVPVLFIFNAMNTIYKVMPLIEGDTLEHHLANHPTPDAAALMNWLLPLLDGLEIVHQAGLQHLDINPATVIIRPDNRPLLLDFGSTRLPLLSLTHAGEQTAMTEFAPPEIHDPDHLSLGAWSDIYSLGALLYYAITGTKPPPALHRMQAIKNLQPDPLPAMDSLVQTTFHPALLLAIKQALQIITLARPQSVAEWKQTLLTIPHSPLEASLQPPSLTSVETIPEEQARQNITMEETAATLEMLTETPDEKIKREAYLTEIKESLFLTRIKHLLLITLLLGIGTTWWLLGERKAISQARTRARAMAGEFVRIAGGQFEMGCGSWQINCYENEKPVQTLFISGFEIGKYEVTQGQWKAVMGTNPAHFSNCGDDCPVEMVSWHDVQTFIAKLNAQSDEKYRLPTESEWEFACRSGGRPKPYCGGNDVDRVAWYRDNAAGKTHPVGQKEPTILGLFDMSGNVLEWTCSDRGKYDDSEQNHTRCSQGKFHRAIRGGNWSYDPINLRSTDRYFNIPESQLNDLGFRLLKEIPQ